MTTQPRASRSMMRDGRAHVCAVCGLAGDLRVVEMWWRRAGMTTCQMCGGCWGRLRIRRAVAAVMYGVGALVTFAAGFATVILVANIFAGRERDRVWFEYWGAVAAAVTVAALATAVLAAKVRVPAPLRVRRRARDLVRFRRLAEGATSAETTSTPAAEPDDPQDAQAAFSDAIVRCIESGASVYALADLCGALPAAVRTFAQYESAKHSPRNVTAHCVVCDAAGSDLLATEWTWQSPADGNRTSTPGMSVLMAMMGHIHLSGGKPVVCRTYHTFCRRCFRSSRNARLLSSAVWLPLALLLIVLFLVAASGLVMGLLEKNHDGRVIGWPVCAGASALLAGVVWLMRVVSRRRIPSALRGIARTPFDLKSVVSLGPLFGKEGR